MFTLIWGISRSHFWSCIPSTPLKVRQPNPSWLRNSWPEVDLLQGNSGHPQWNFFEISADQMALFQSQLHPPNDVHFEKKLLRYIKYVGFEFSIVFHSYTFYTRITRMSVLEWPKVKVSKTFWPWNLGSQIPRPGPRTPLIKCPSPLWKKTGLQQKNNLSNNHRLIIMIVIIDA